MKTIQEHENVVESHGGGTSSERVVREGLSEKMTFELGLKSRRAQPCREQEEELCRQKEQRAPRKAVVCRV